MKNSLTIFLYHDVSEKPSEFSQTHKLNVPPQVFRFQMRFIKKNFNIVGPDDLLQAHLPPYPALITFDDGLRGYFKNAVPILEEYQIPSLIFLNMASIQGGIFWSGLITYLCSKQPDFVEFLKRRCPAAAIKEPLYLNCERILVEEYLEQTGKNFKAEVEEFIGEFARENDLREASHRPLVFFGNHLFNHEVPILMSDKSLVESFLKNSHALEQYACYRNWFSFPFGQPGTCFTLKQVALLEWHGAQKIFSSLPLINFNPSSVYLHRITLTGKDDTTQKICFRICGPTVRKKLRIPA